MEQSLSISGTPPDSAVFNTVAAPAKAGTAARRPRRPCDACRKRKSRCEMQEGELACVLCKFHHQTCSFNENPQPRKKRKGSDTFAVEGGGILNGARDNINSAPLDPSADASSIFSSIEKIPITSNIRQDQPINDYADLKGPSLLKTTLGLQNHQHSKILGLTSE